jgi:hypothetical protein
MRNQAATDRIMRDLHDVLNTMRADLDRVELLATALSVFSRPIPAYEPRFNHIHHLAMGAEELGKAASPKQ